ncbi:MAG: hypothetical protein AB1696_16880 [Planctomycetota bacterium]
MTECAEPDRRLIGVRVVKSEVRLETEKPKVSVTPETCSVSKTYFGDNPSEAFFDIEIPMNTTGSPTVRVEWPGVTVKKVWAGHTAVEFKSDGDAVVFDAPLDFRNPFSMHQRFGDEETALVCYMHKPEARRSGNYRDIPWPQVEKEAEGNLIFAALEVFKDMRPGAKGNKDFEGAVNILGYETTFPRSGSVGKTYGHVDHPPHFHIFLVHPPGWRIRQASHLHIAPDGNLTGTNRCQPSACEGERKTYGPGEVCQQRDMDGKLAFELATRKDGSLMIRKNETSPPYFIKPDPDAGSFGTRAFVYKGDDLLCVVTVKDDCPKGEMTINREYHKDGKPDRTETEAVRYAPDLGTEISRTVE